MDIRHAVHPEQARTFDTEELRKSFLIQELFSPGKIRLVYSYYDRLIVGGIQPASPLKLEVDERIIGSKYLLERREMGIINIGGEGIIKVDGSDYTLGNKDALYIGAGVQNVTLTSANENQPAKYYLLCAPAHQNYPTTKISMQESEPLHLGSDEQSNRRTIYKFIHPDGVRSCQLVMGLTILAPKNVWNTMPTHTHERRIEAYFYFDFPKDDVVVHLMGQPSETRHLILRSEEAVLSPSWSIHSGVGTRNYSFIWGMAGENQAFTDMDDVPTASLR
ncbi:MAG: 5-dehydro-4-deoxy-D-glucuronate isomerase [Spirochaetaceae bacterium]|nr:MAG: 5-dehydro-4-deoxy-D-glucuronate isomerase [Spirochaetaceae bacterium]